MKSGDYKSNNSRTFTSVNFALAKPMHSKFNCIALSNNIPMLLWHPSSHQLAPLPQLNHNRFQMDDVALVGAGHVVCTIQHDDVGELYFQGFVYANLFWVLCIPTTATTTRQPELKYAMFTGQG